MLAFLLKLPSPSFAEWIWVGKNTSEDKFYVDFGSIRKAKGFLYYWELLEPGHDVLHQANELRLQANPWGHGQR